jgi:three-Cys-motif partner protein
LRKARGGLANIKRTLKIKCLFIEKDVVAYRKLTQFLSSTRDLETWAINGEFEDNVNEVIRFAGSSFALFFIDPTGWTGFGMNVIAPVLEYKPGEVLINFMTKDILRFIDSKQPGIRATFTNLFGKGEFQERWRGLSGLEREEAIVEAYCERVKEVGKFRFVISAIVLHPQNERTHFHLIYGTRHPEGLRTFRDIERKAMKQQGLVRAAAQERERSSKSQQPMLLPLNEVPNKGYFNELWERYHEAARRKVRAALEASGRMLYEAVEEIALVEPLTANEDLDDWLGEWRKEGLIRFEGLKPKERKPKPDKGHYIVWAGERQLKLL